MPVVYRKARRADCLRLAELIDIASGGVVEFMFHDLVPNLTPVQIVAQNLESSHGVHTYSNVIVAEVDQQVMGMSLSYPSSFHKITAEMQEFFPKDRLNHLADFYASRVENSFYLDALCVDQKLRGNGIGSQLISLTKKKAVKSGFDTLSQIVFADNNAALNVYRHNGFETVTSVSLNSHTLIPHKGGCLLLKCSAGDI